MKNKRKITFIPQVADGGDYDLFTSFFYLKHFHENKTRFIEVCREGIHTVSPRYETDKKYIRISKRYTNPFHLFLQYISNEFIEENLYIALNEEFARDLLVMFIDLYKNKISFKEITDGLFHHLEFKLYLTHDRLERVLPFAEKLAITLPKYYDFKVYLDTISDYCWTKIIEEDFSKLNIPIIPVHNFRHYCSSRNEIISFYNDQLKTIDEVLLIKPILERLNE